MNKERPTVTLCMIVKDEEHIIRECLESIYKYVDRYDISDTGSTDKTKEIIKEFFDEKGIPGEIYDDPWQGFGKSRTQALRNCDGKADYAWVIDADDFVEGHFEYPKEFGQHWAYTLLIKRGDFEWWRNQIFKTGVGWEYVGVLHEYANCPDIQEKGGSIARIAGNYGINARTMGNRTQEFQDDWRKKYLNDAETLLKCLTDENDPNYEPDNLRYYFYLAQSYFDGGDFENALKWYEARAERGGWEEEVWYSVLRCAMCMVNLGKPWYESQDVFLQAYNLRPTRAEPLYQLARIHRINGNPRLGYLFAKQAATINYPMQDLLFVSKDVYDWQSLDELGSTAWYAGDMQSGLAACNKLLNDKKYPQEQHERIFNNWKNYVSWFDQMEAKKNEAEEKKKVSDSEARKQLARDRQQQKQINKRRAKKTRSR